MAAAQSSPTVMPSAGVFRDDGSAGSGDGGSSKQLFVTGIHRASTAPQALPL